uniref:Cytochrome b561 domain-containing protein n=1 Tax=Clastoptera arizonana TaxID=38151 RepID=A0A1B6DWF8_9HEMI
MSQGVAVISQTRTHTTITGGGSKMDTMEDLQGFNLIFIITQVVGVILVILVGIWTGYYRGGFAWSSSPSLEFNWHPLLMTIGMIYFFANSILIYRSLRTLRKDTLKKMHAAIHFTVLILVIIAQIAVLDSHNLAKPNPIPNFYSLHSWAGILTLIIFFLQYVFGFLGFLYPKFSDSLRAAMLPVHVYLGLTAFVLACATSLMGLTEKAIFSIGNYSQFPSEGILLNFIGIFIIVFAGFVLYLATKLSYKRHNRPEDSNLLRATE